MRGWYRRHSPTREQGQVRNKYLECRMRNYSGRCTIPLSNYFHIRNSTSFLYTRESRAVFEFKTTLKAIYDVRVVQSVARAFSKIDMREWRTARTRRKLARIERFSTIVLDANSDYFICESFLATRCELIVKYRAFINYLSMSRESDVNCDIASSLEWHFLIVATN